jgi:hypothetical protein
MMASISFGFEDRLDDALSFLSWKVRVTLILNENDLWDIVVDDCSYVRHSPAYKPERC